MASIGHIAVGLAAARRYARAGPRGQLARWMIIFSGLSLLPDADVVAFALGVRYGSPFGHRGASHSLVVAAAIGALAGCVALGAGAARRAALRVALYAGIVVASHGLLDTLTDGGLGVALLWPFSAERFFAPWRPVPVAPIGLAFLSQRGLHCVLVEGLLFAPLFAYALLPRRMSRRDAPSNPC
jgi:inner membrane protein